MSIIPVSRLSSSDLTLLGNNLRPDSRRIRPRTKNHELLATVNRSLARLGERVTKLHNRVSVAS